MDIIIVILLVIIIIILLQINSKLPNMNDPVEEALKRDEKRKVMEKKIDSIKDD